MSLDYGFALKDTDNSAQFSEVFKALFGDGITGFGGRFALTLKGGFTVTLAPGEARVNGRYVGIDEPLSLTLQPSGNTSDRYDAIAARVVYGDKAGKPEILWDVNPAAIRADTSVIRNENEYSLILYFIHVKRGSTVLTEANIIDTRGEEKLCGYITRMDAISGDVQRVYDFLDSGVDAEVQRVLDLSTQLMEKADKAIGYLDSVIQTKNFLQIGDVTEGKTQPAPEAAWLLCDGGPVPEGYAELEALIGGTLPNIAPADRRFKSWIYGGMPVYTN